MLELITPHLRISNLKDIDLALLKRINVKGLLLDLDCTLVEYGKEEMAGEIIEWIGVLRNANIGLCIVSNAHQVRVDLFARKLGTHGVANACKPLSRGCQKAIALLSLPPEEIAIVGDQVFADIVAGRLAGVFTILIPPSTKDEPWFTRVKRPVERLWLRYLK